MVRWSVVAASAAVVVGAAFVTGSSLPGNSFEQPPRAEGLKNLSMTSQKFGFFNMVRVMRESHRAAFSSKRLAERKDQLAHNVMGLREMHRVLLSSMQESQQRQEQTQHELILLIRQIEDLERESNKSLSTLAARAVTELDNDIHAAAAELAQKRRLSAVLAYPDIASPEELDSPQVRELRLKPAALMPFHLDPALDYTDELIELLNAKVPAEE
jgi:Skp family chaperone for outer membrane proteins